MRERVAGPRHPGVWCSLPYHMYRTIPLPAYVDE
jgi:hypothetical protein